MYINEQPEIGMTIQVMPSDRPPFQAEARKVVPMIQLAQVQPGQMVEVKYDPNDTSKVALSAILSGGMGGMQMAALSQIPPELQQIVMQQNALSATLFQSGQPATKLKVARIIVLRTVPRSSRADSLPPLVFWACATTVRLCRTALLQRFFRWKYNRLGNHLFNPSPLRSLLTLHRRNIPVVRLFKSSLTPLTIAVLPSFLPEMLYNMG